MNKVRFELGLAGSMALLVAGCATQTPAEIVSGFGRQMDMMMKPVQTPHATAAAQPKPATVKTAQGDIPVMQVTKIEDTPAPKIAAKPLMADEELGEIAPAAGPKPHVAAAVDVAEPEPVMVKHTVTAADTAYKLARTYNVPVDRLLKDNGLKSTADIRVGQVLTIASGSKPKSTAWDEMKRTLTPTTQLAAQPAKAQEAMEPVKTAAAQHVDLAAIEPAAGERPKAEPEVAFERHTVQPKETIYRISLKYNVSVLDIMAANDFEQPQDLKADTVIKVPMKRSITQQLAAKPDGEIAPAAGGVAESIPAAPVVVETAGKPVQVAMLSAAPTGAKEAQREDLETKAVKQQAFKDAVLPTSKDAPLGKDDEAKAEMKRGHVDPEAARSKGMVWPVRGEIVQRFGDDGKGVARTGINIAVPKGTPVLASEGGTVLYADDGLKIYGKLVLVRHNNGMVSAYAHNSYLLVRKNEKVKKGQVIALSGASGNVETPQLHFELRQHASAVDPVAMLPRL